MPPTSLTSAFPVLGKMTLTPTCVAAVGQQSAGVLAARSDVHKHQVGGHLDWLVVLVSGAVPQLAV